MRIGRGGSSTSLPCLWIEIWIVDGCGNCSYLRTWLACLCNNFIICESNWNDMICLMQCIKSDNEVKSAFAF